MEKNTTSQKRKRIKMTKDKSNEYEKKYNKLIKEQDMKKLDKKRDENIFWKVMVVIFAIASTFLAVTGIIAISEITPQNDLEILGEILTGISTATASALWIMIIILFIVSKTPKEIAEEKKV